jgi:hypothetical protein
MDEISIPITKKEEMLVKTLVRLYKKERLVEEFNDILGYGDVSSDIVKGAGKLLGIDPYSLRNIGIQYINYSINNYEDIKNNIFPPDIERVKEGHFYADEAESVIQYNRKRAVAYVLESKLGDFEDSVYERFYEFDPDTLDTDYGDSDFIDFTPDKKSNMRVSYKNNVLM